MQILFINRLRLGLLVGLVIAALLLLLWSGGAFRSVQLSLSDTYFVARQTSETIVIIAIDDASFQRFGRSPAEWSRSVYADLLKALAAANPRVLAIDLLFSEEAPGDNVLQQEMLALRQNEARTQIVLAAAGVQLALKVPSESYTAFLAYSSTLYPRAEIQSIANHIGFVNAFPDRDSIIRRQPSLIQVHEQIEPSFALATYLAYLRIPRAAISQVVTQNENTLNVTPQRQIEIDENGFWLQNFFGAPSITENHTFPIISLLDVLDGTVDPSIFNDKIVMLGLYTVSGDADRYATPASAGVGLMPGIEIHANAVESLMQGLALKQVPRGIEALLITVFAVLASLLTVYPRWYWKIIIAVALALIAFIGALLVFNLRQYYVLMFYPLLALVLPALVMIGIDSSREIALRLRSEFFLQSVLDISQQRLQMEAMLPEIAKDIQEILPQSKGVIFVREAADVHLMPAYHWGEALTEHDLAQGIVEQTALLHDIQQMGKTVIVPIWWQGRTLGVIAVVHPLAFQRRFILRDLAKRLAPTFENAYLYNEVASQRSTLSTLLASTPAAVLVLDSTYRVQIFNETALELFPVQRLQNQALLDVLDALAVAEDAQSKILKKLKESEEFRLELTVQEETYQVEAALIPTLNQWVLLLNDITDLTQLSNLKTRLLRMASHDLKNPLGRIMGYTQLLQMRPTADEKTQKYLTYILSAAEEMNQLILDLLDLERMRSGKINTERFDLRAVVQQVYSRHEPDTTRKQQTYQQEILDDAIWTVGDLRQISQVISNLVGNAIKYTPDGGTITVSLRRDNDLAHFEVQDTGYGISKEAQEKLFTEFYRVKTEETASISGTGLGLSLVKSVVDAHGGVVGVESEAGQGSRFYVDLPIQNEEANHA